MIQLETAIYIELAMAGIAAGCIRFIHTKRVWKLREALGCSLFGGLLSITYIGIVFGSNVSVHYWKCLGLSLFLGYFQPNLAPMIVPAVEQLLKGLLAGIHRKSDDQKDDK